MFPSRLKSTVYLLFLSLSSSCSIAWIINLVMGIRRLAASILTSECSCSGRYKVVFVVGFMISSDVFICGNHTIILLFCQLSVCVKQMNEVWKALIGGDNKSSESAPASAHRCHSRDSILPSSRISLGALPLVRVWMTSSMRRVHLCLSCRSWMNCPKTLFPGKFFSFLSNVSNELINL